MKNEIAAVQADERRQQVAKIRWLWSPVVLLLVAALGLMRVNQGWSVLAVSLATLWVVLGSVGFTVLEGFSAGGAGVFGYGPKVRDVGIFASYRQRPTQLATLGIYLVFALIGVLTPGMPADKVDGGFLLVGLAFVLVAGPLDLCNWWLSRRYGDWPTMRQALAVWVPAALLGQLFNWLMLDFMVLLHPGVVFEMHYWAGPVVGLSYLLVLSGLHRDALRWQGRIEQANQRADEADTARRLAEARLAVLQAQIEPHFLYNTLATVQYLLKGEPGAADFLLTQLIRYLRLAMPSMRQFSSTLGREFELTDAYLQIARLRMGGRLSVDLDLATALEGVEFPPLVLQTLVENAIKHGIEPKTGPVRIRVFVQRGDAELRVCVQDDGVGLGGAATQGGGTGLQNIRERLQGIYGERARLSIAGLPQGGVLASVTLPLNQERYL